MHEQWGWSERAANSHLPYWLRVAALCYGHHRANGHAVFGPGDIRAALARIAPGTGEVTRPDPSLVTRAIRTAVGHGWLAKGSNARCLIAPGHIGGGLGSEHDRCPVHDGRRRASERPMAA